MYLTKSSKINVNVDDKIENTTIFITGTGLGSVIALTAARGGFRKFILIPEGSDEPRDWGAETFDPRWVGCEDLETTKSLLLEIHPDVEVFIIEDLENTALIDMALGSTGIVINTVSLSHGAFTYCNNKAREFDIPVVFPLPIDWGAALMVLTGETLSLEESLELADDGEYGFDEIKAQLLSRAGSSDTPGYLLPLIEKFKKPARNEWICDPGIAVSTSISTSMAVTAALSLVTNEPVKEVPHICYVDFYEMEMTG